MSDEFEKGVFFFEQEDYQKAADWWTKGAEKGYARAQAALGHFFEQGGYYKEAEYWYIKAAEQGDVNAQTHLGRIYADEDTGLYDRTKAKYWLSKAAIQGEEEAAEDLEVIVRFEKAEAEYKGTVDANTEARYQLAYTYFIDKQYDKAFSILNDLADKGHANSQYILGLCYGRGDGLEQDHEKAAKWWCKASEQGHAEAIHFLKLLCKKDWDTLLRWTSLEKTDSKLSQITQNPAKIKISVPTACAVKALTSALMGVAAHTAFIVMLGASVL